MSRRGGGAFTCMRICIIGSGWSNGTRPVEHLEQDRRDRVEIGAAVDERPSACSGAMYAGVPNTRPVVVSLRAAHRGLGVADQLDQPEVDDLRALPAAHVDEHDVVGLEIAVHEAVRVRVADAVEQLAREHERAARRQRALRRATFGQRARRRPAPSRGTGSRPRRTRRPRRRGSGDRACARALASRANRFVASAAGSCPTPAT